MLDEVRAAIAKMKKNKSTGIDNITAEEIQAAARKKSRPIGKGSDCAHTQESEIT